MQEVVGHEDLGVFHKRFASSPKYSLEILFLMTISSCEFVRVPNAMRWAHVQSVSLKFSR